MKQKTKIYNMYIINAIYPITQKGKIKKPHPHAHFYLCL